MVKGRALDLFGPSAGLAAVICAVPAAAMSVAATPILISVLLTKVVLRGDPFHWPMAPFRNPVPVIVSSKAAPPWVALAGFRAFRTGAGFGFTTLILIEVLAVLPLVSVAIAVKTRVPGLPEIVENCAL